MAAINKLELDAVISPSTTSSNVKGMVIFISLVNYGMFNLHCVPTSWFVMWIWSGAGGEERNDLEDLWDAAGIHIRIRSSLLETDALTFAVYLSQAHNNAWPPSPDSWW